MLSAMGFTNFLNGGFVGVKSPTDLRTFDPNKPNRTSKYVDAMGRGETLDLWIFVWPNLGLVFFRWPGTETTSINRCGVW